MFSILPTGVPLKKEKSISILPKTVLIGRWIQLQTTTLYCCNSKYLYNVFRYNTDRNIEVRQTTYEKKKKKKFQAALTKSFKCQHYMSVAGHNLPETKQTSIGTDVKQHITINKEGCDDCVNIYANAVADHAKAPDLAVLETQTVIQ